MKKKLLGLLLIICILLTACNSTQDDNKVSESDGQLKYGKLLEEKNNCTKYNDDLSCLERIIVLKAKIEASLTKNMTIKQNYHTVFDYIQKNISDTETIKELQYWAIADMDNGNESKVISFTIPKTIIEKIINNSITALELQDNVEELYIHPSLK